MLSGKSTFVAPQIVKPSTLEWTQIIEQGSTYTLSFEPEASLIEVQSSFEIHSLGFVFNAIPLFRKPDESFQLLIATIRVLADEEFYKEYTYEGLPSDQASVPISDNFSFK